MKKIIFIIFGFIIIHCQLFADTNTAENSESSIVIHYGLNDSHSRSWVQENSEGIIGISYFQRLAGSYDEGNLIYKTINPDESENFDTVTAGVRLEKSVLLYDSSNNPHIFVASSNNSNQVIFHYYQDDQVQRKNNAIYKFGNNDQIREIGEITHKYNDGGQGQWTNEIVHEFYNEGGKFIYELSADNGPDGSFHLLVLKTRSDVDSDDFMDAWMDSYLYHISNFTGTWTKQLIHHYDMAYTYDMCIKTSSRQDIKIDKDGKVHAVFSEQIRGGDYPSRLRYVTNKTGVWKLETALSYDYGPDDDAGWFPSLSLDNNDIPHISCMYIHRVPTKSATYCKLFFLKRLEYNSWQSEIIADTDDGYYGGDGRRYTGGLTHLVFDNDNKPHIIFSDIASTHWAWQQLCVGNIRYGTLIENNWTFTTIYRQPLPTAFYNATEMFGMCLIVSEITNSIRIAGQEMIITGENQYTCDLVDFEWANNPTDFDARIERPLPTQFKLDQNYPNPFNPCTSIMFSLPRQSHVLITVYNMLGQKVNTLINDVFPAGNHSINWDGTDIQGEAVSTGIYLYRFQAGEFIETKKMLLQK